MKNLSLLMILILTACGGVGTEPRQDNGPSIEVGVEAGGDSDKDSIEQDLSKNKGCTDAVQTSIVDVAQFCAANMNVEVNKTLCLVTARALVSEHPNFVCSLESGQLVDADYIQDKFISKIEKSEN